MSSSDPSQGPSTHASKSRVSGEHSDAAGERQPKTAVPSAGLYIVSTPIGNLRDITLRALDVLAGVDEVLAEDTRTARRLMDAHGLKPRLSAYHDHNGASRRPDLIARLQDGAALALISDAGTPLVSDPGWKLVRDAAAAGVAVVPVPGASAMLAGLVASGLPSDRFMFAGFLPPKTSARKQAAATLSAVPATLVFYESGPRLGACLADLAETLGGDREAVVARELTKLFEETRRGTLSSLAAHYAEAGAPRGEIVVLVGPPTETAVSAEDVDIALRDALTRLPTKAAAAEVAEALGMPKRDCYQRALALKAETRG